MKDFGVISDGKIKCQIRDIEEISWKFSKFQCQIRMIYHIYYILNVQNVPKKETDQKKEWITELASLALRDACLYLGISHVPVDTWKQVVHSRRSLEFIVARELHREANRTRERVI